MVEQLSNMLVLDIETVPAYESYSDLSDEFQKLWVIKHNQLRLGEEITAEESYSERAGIFAEFGKIVCISVGVITEQDGDIGMRIKSFYGDDERVMLSEFCDMLYHNYRDAKNKAICGHNIREFDIPYLCRRILINGLKMPSLLNFRGRKPWEVNHVDTMQLWKFGDFKSYTSLKLLTAVFDIPTPKDDIDGSDVARVYWKEKDLEKIVKYCEKDVIAVARLWMKLESIDIVHDKNIIHV
ncbi:MAG: 3'-5' exonuclease [Chitinophagales bacterium]|nr:3'-5' exonuclease [Chitinophagales bacterium]